MIFSIKVESDLELLSRQFEATKNEKAYEHFASLQKEQPNNFQYIDPSDQKIFQKFWASVIVHVKGRLELRPMRYGLGFRSQPEANAQKYSIKQEELNSEDLQRISRFKALLPIKSFYLMNKQDLKFSLDEHSGEDQLFYAPAIYDSWFSSDKSQIIQSFAILEENGKDHCPIELSYEEGLSWLQRD